MKISSKKLAPQFEWRQFCFRLDALMIVEENIIVNERSGLRESLNFGPVDALCFENGKEIFSQSIVIWIPTS